MVRFLLDKFRTVPGPFRQARVIAADLAEELLDLARYRFEERRHPSGKNGWVPAPPPPSETPPREEPPGPPEAATPGTAPSKPAKQKTGKPKETGPNLPANLAAAIGVPANLKKQDFKILAILWDAGNRSLGPLSAKGISHHGAQIGIPIRHENVRKVIRSKLEKHIAVHTEIVGNGTVYRYEINPDGRLHFERTFLEPGA